MSTSNTVRFATFNASLNRFNAGDLITDLSTPDNAQAQAIAETIQRNNPDVVLINEFDYDTSGQAAQLFQQNYLGVSQNGVNPVEYPYVYVAASNTGVASGFDFNNNGTVGGPDDAFGFGFFPGQFGFVIYSRHPIVADGIRTFQNFLWKDMPGALLPVNPDGTSWYSPEELDVFRLSSKNHVDVPIEVNGEIIHVLASHPTPPVFDGPEDRNGTRNFDEIRFWADYINDASYIYDDAGVSGGLALGEAFVIMGDQNSDPFDGDSIPGAAQQLLNHPLVNISMTPSSEGGIDATDRQGLNSADHLGDPGLDTADFGETPFGPGNLRADYALPSVNLNITEAGVFWLPNEDPLFDSLNGDFPFPTSDHRLVYVDVTTGVEAGRGSVSDIEFLGEVQFPTGFEFGGTEVGGISGLAYDPNRDVYYGLSDDRSQINDARFYTLSIDLNDGSLDDGDVAFETVTTLLDETGNPFPAFSLDPEGIVYSSIGTLYISSEGDANALIPPFINQFSLNGQQIDSLPVSDIYLPTADQTSGIRNNLAFESLAVTPNQKFLYTATENALYQDGPAATLDTDSPARIIQYDLTTGEPVAEFIYPVDAVPETPIPADGFSTNGLVELLAVNDDGTLLALERGFSVGQGNTVKLFEIDTHGALNVLGQDSLTEAAIANGAVTKRELLDVEADLGISPDNLEALALGPVLPDGRQSLIIASDNNFNAVDQLTQFLAFAVDFDARDTMPNGVASGDVTQDSVVLWTRSTILGDVTFEYSTSTDFSTIAGTAVATVTDATIPVKVEIDGLLAGTDYYYRVKDAAGTVKTGQFETAAELGQYAGLTFGVTGDWRGELAPYPAISNVAERNLDFFVKHGDTIYADDDSPALLNPDGTLKPQAESLEDYRIKHDEVYSEQFGINSWAEVHASTAVYATIDDHEVTNDFAGGQPIGTDARFTNAFPTDDPTALINDSTLYENGLQVFQEYNPIRDEFYGETGDAVTANERKLYRYNTFGSDAATFVLDTRSFRDTAIPTPANAFDPAQVAATYAATFTPDRTLLGSVQLEDLKADLLDAQASGVTWKFLMVPEPFQNLFPGINTDSWDGYNAERTELLKFIEDNNIDNVVFVAADVHMTSVNNITYQETPFGEHIATSTFEITTGAVAYEDPTGRFLGEIFTATDPSLQAFYNSLPIAPDSDSIPNDKDDFVESAINDFLLSPLGFDPIGLDNNLPQAEGLIDAELLQGDYYVGHSSTWTEFDIDPITQKLIVTTYGVDGYEEAELLADPEAIINQTPVILSQFEVNADFSESSEFNSVEGTDNGEVLKGTNGRDRINAGAGDDTLIGRKGDDLLLGGNGEDRMVGDNGDDTFDGGLGDDAYIGGQGADTFVLRLGEGVDAIRDFRAFQGDAIALVGGLTFGDLTIERFGAKGAQLFAGDELLATVQSTRFSAINTESVFTTL